MNFGETLAFWYLRLNGFLPMANFVLHKVPRQGGVSDADADLLAVRFPHVGESIDGDELACDTNRWRCWGLDWKNCVLALVCEVKTGAMNAKQVDAALSGDRLARAIRRLGVVAPKLIAGLVKDLSTANHARRKDVQIAKLLVHHEAANCSVPCMQLKLADATQFVRERMNQFADPKRAARFFFPSELIQFLAWNAAEDVTREPPTGQPLPRPAGHPPRRPVR